MATHTKLLIGIIIGIVAGALLGGWWPAAGVTVSVLGDGFLNMLMVLVVPLVVFSMVVGITGLGDIRRVGKLGLRTITYYFCTTAIAVALGLVAVNIIRPGAGVTPGETLAGSAYTVGGPDNRTVTLRGDRWSRAGYGQQFLVILDDQRLRGRLATMTDSTVTVALWERITDRGEVVEFRSEDGELMPFRRIDGRLVSQEPVPDTAGVGVRIGRHGPSLLSALSAARCARWWWAARNAAARE